MQAMPAPLGRTAEREVVAVVSSLMGTVKQGRTSADRETGPHEGKGEEEREDKWTVQASSRSLQGTQRKLLPLCRV